MKTETTYVKKGDCVYTPSWCAEDMVNHFKPEGLCLEPCYGEGVIHNLLPENSLFSEIAKGIDFYEFDTEVVWIITNPPFSHFSKFMKHGINLSKNSVWLLPTWKVYSGAGLQMFIKERGGIKHMRHYGTGTRLGWSPLANMISAVHIQRGYEGDISQSWYEHKAK